MASLEITQSRGRRQTLRISKPGLSVSGNFSGSSRQVLQQLADGETRLQQQNHLVSIDSYVRAPRNNFGDRARQRFFLRNVSGSARLWLRAAIRFSSVVVRILHGFASDLPRGHIVREIGVQPRSPTWGTADSP
jgi:hypothetical protein